MGNEEFEKYALELVKDKIYPEQEVTLFVVWLCKIIENNKCLISSCEDSKYIEVTYHGARNKTYLDVYEKESHKEVDYEGSK